MNTLLYYTANRVAPSFAERVRANLASHGCPIVSVSQQPLPGFGLNVCLGDIGFSVYNVYRQILEGVRRVETDVVVCCEDDCLYSDEHLAFQPTRNAFFYNTNRWTVNSSGIAWKRVRTMMGMCIAPTELLLETMERRLQAYPDPASPRVKYFSEPGKYEGHLGLPKVELQRFETEVPTVNFNHRPSLGGVRRLNETDQITDVIPGWGPSEQIWRTYWG